MNLKEYKIYENGSISDFMKEHQKSFSFTDTFITVREKFAKSAFEYDGESIFIKGLKIDESGKYILSDEKNVVQFNIEDNIDAFDKFLSIDVYRNFKGDIYDYFNKKRDCLNSLEESTSGYFARFCATNDSEFYDDGRKGRTNLNYHLGLNEDKPSGCNISLIKESSPLNAYANYETEINNYGSTVAFVKIPEDGFLTYFKPHYLADKIDVLEMYHMSEPEAIYACIKHMGREDFKTFFLNNEKVEGLLHRFNVEESLRGSDFSKSREVVEAIRDNIYEIIEDNSIMQEGKGEVHNLSFIDKLLGKEIEKPIYEENLNINRLVEFIENQLESNKSLSLFD